MGFWDLFRKKTADEEGGKLRRGKKHGRWVERSEKEITRWDPVQKMYVKDGFAKVVLEYVDGVRHGPFVRYFDDGTKLTEGAYVNGELDGRCASWERDGTLALEVDFRAGKHHGRQVTYNHGVVESIVSLVDGKRHGPYEKRATDGVVLEAGSYDAGERSGHWTFRRPDGAVRAEGDFAAGKMTGEWRAFTTEGKALAPRAYADEAELDRWLKLETFVELLVGYEPTDAWATRAQAVFTAEKVDSYWKLRLMAGVPVSLACRDQCWSLILELVDKIGGVDAVRCALRAGRMPTFAPRDWLTRVLEGETDDPRNRLVSRFEPGRELPRAKLRRLVERVPHLQQVTFRECRLPDGLLPFFETPLPELDRLLVVRCDVRAGTTAELATVSMPKVVQLALVGNGETLGDAELAALLANLPSLESLTLDHVKLQIGAGRALADCVNLRSVDLRESEMSRPGLEGLARAPALEELKLRDCTLPRLTKAQAQEIRVMWTGKLRRLELDTDDERARATATAAIPVAADAPPPRGQVITIDLSQRK